MFRKLTSLFTIFVATVLFSSLALAQLPEITLTADDIDLFVQSGEAGMAGQAAFLEGLSPELQTRAPIVVAKLAHAAAAYSAPGATAEMINMVLDSNPTMKFSPEEKALVESHKDTIVAAYQKMYQQ
ncbi:MAG: hypothetical protein LBE31_04655 [Deltaproteobacteria bacterium]|jgi:hypothetical protein|nr:hypothetical protein [Deltaproteobacteria bacterium]